MVSVTQLLILVGHNIINDMKVLDRPGINLHDHFDLIGIADTQVLVQDSSAECLPEGLSDLVLQYQLYASVYYSRRKRSGKGGKIFLGAHNAGNDAVADLKLLICFIFDSLLDDDDDDDWDEDAYMADVFESVKAQDRIDEWIKRAMHDMNPNLITTCFDYEGVGDDTSEFGFAWYRTADLIAIDPDEKGNNWWPFLKAKHFLVDNLSGQVRRFSLLAPPLLRWRLSATHASPPTSSARPSMLR